jgi:hypothetical protein
MGIKNAMLIRDCQVAANLAQYKVKQKSHPWIRGGASSRLSMDSRLIPSSPIYVCFAMTINKSKAKLRLELVYIWNDLFFHTDNSM